MGLFNKLFKPSQISSEIFKASLLDRLYLIEGINKIKTREQTISTKPGKMLINFSEGVVAFSPELSSYSDFEHIRIIEKNLDNECTIHLGKNGRVEYILATDGNNIAINKIGGHKIIFPYSSAWVTTIKFI